MFWPNEGSFDPYGELKAFKKDFKLRRLIKVSGSLKSILKIPFTIKDHFAALRPAVIERRPFVGLHPEHSSIGILNGTGTKGCSLAPYFAYQFTQCLLNNIAIDRLADVKRFSGILSYKIT